MSATPPGEGSIIFVFYLDGTSWDFSLGCLRESLSLSGQRFNPLPELLVTPIKVNFLLSRKVKIKTTGNDSKVVSRIFFWNLTRRQAQGKFTRLNFWIDITSKKFLTVNFRTLFSHFGQKISDTAESKSTPTKHELSRLQKKSKN